MRGIGLVVLAALLGGCTSVKMVQRDGCWIRQTKRTLAGAKEEIGPCTRPQPRWSDDRLTRLVQECVAQADYRWQGHALAAWSRGDPLPRQPARETVIETCLSQAATGVVSQTEALRERLADVSSDRDALRAHAAQGDDHLRETSTKLAEYLGDAARRPPPVATATATATSDGTATTESGLESQTGSTSQTLPAAASPLAPVVPAAAPATPPAPAASPTLGAQPPGVAPAPRADACAPRTADTKTPKVARARKPPRPAARRDGCDVPGAADAKRGEIAARPPADPPPPPAR
jgi:hypothetical protein